MQKRAYTLIFLLYIISVPASWSQTVEITGNVVANGDVENIHIINASSRKFTTTTNSGTFIIPVKYGDTLKLTSVRYKAKDVLISRKVIKDKSITVYLEENINELDEVIVGKILTGDLGSDILNSDFKRDIDFYDLGLPGYTGKPLTQSERRLAEADAGKMFYVGLGAGVNFHKLLNAISGRTKMLKERVRLERNTELMNSIKDRLSKDFFSEHPLDEQHIKDFFYFCSEDEDFEERCRGRSDFEIFEFLKEKYDVYIENLKSKKD